MQVASTHPCLTSPSEVATFLTERGIRPNKVLGQNFLIDSNILGIIVAASKLTQDTRVIEVGPGLGALTERLLDSAKSVLAIEKDHGLAKILRERFAKSDTFSLIENDALECNLSEYFARKEVDVFVSNLPYSVGHRILADLTISATPPKTMVLLLQREVGERLVAKPCTSDMGAISVWVQQVYKVEIVKKVSRNCFYPPPDVESVVVRFSRHHEFDISNDERQKLIHLTKEAFLHRRKQLASAMRNANGGLARPSEFVRHALENCGLTTTARPEELSVKQWVNLSLLW